MSDNYVDEASNNTNNSDEYVLYVHNKYLTPYELCLLQFVHKCLSSFLLLTRVSLSHQVKCRMIRIKCFTYLIIIVIKCDFILLVQIFQICWNISDSQFISPLLLMACIFLMHLGRTKLDSIHNLLHESTWFIPGT